MPITTQTKFGNQICNYNERAWIGVAELQSLNADTLRDLFVDPNKIFHRADASICASNKCDEV